MSTKNAFVNKVTRGHKMCGAEPEKDHKTVAVFKN